MRSLYYPYKNYSNKTDDNPTTIKNRDNVNKLNYTYTNHNPNQNKKDQIYEQIYVSTLINREDKGLNNINPNKNIYRH